MFEGDKLFIPKVTFFPLYFPIQQLVFSSEISIRRLELQILWITVVIPIARLLIRVIIIIIMNENWREISPPPLGITIIDYCTRLFFHFLSARNPSERSVNRPGRDRRRVSVSGAPRAWNLPLLSLLLLLLLLLLLVVSLVRIHGLSMTPEKLSL